MRAQRGENIKQRGAGRIEAELIEESDERPAPELDDARRRYYRLTALGKRVLDAECERLQELVQTIRMKQAPVTE